MFKSVKKYIVRHWIAVLQFCVVAGGVFFMDTALATTTIATIATNVDSGIVALAKVLQDVSLVTGIGFILASFFKLHQHSKNPQQVGMSQGVTLLIIGAGLAVFPHLLDTATKGIFGVSTVQVGGSAINAIIKKS